VRARGTYPPADDEYRLADLRDEIRSLKTAVVLLGVLGVIALGVAAWALLSNNDDSGTTRSGVSPARVSELERRVSDLASQVRRAPAKSDLAALADRQKALGDRVAAIEKTANDAASQQSVDQIQQNLQDLQKRVDEIEQQQQDQSATSP
jgi:hypothetical protein